MDPRQSRAHVANVEKIRTALDNNQLVLIIGAGASLLATRGISRITWKGLIKDGLDFLQSERLKKADDPEIAFHQSMLNRDNLDGRALLRTCQYLKDELEESKKFPDWLYSAFRDLGDEVRQPQIYDVLREFHQRGAKLMTTNYDELIEKFCHLQRVRPTDPDDVRKYEQDYLDGVFHIHGSYQDPKDVVLDPVGYYQVRQSENVQSLLKAYLGHKAMLFVGCGSGLDDPNFHGLLNWASTRDENLPGHHFVLIRDDEDVNYPPLVSVRFGPGFEDLVPFLRSILHPQESTTTASAAVTATSNAEEESSEDRRVAVLAHTLPLAQLTFQESFDRFDQIVSRNDAQSFDETELSGIYATLKEIETVQAINQRLLNPRRFKLLLSKLEFYSSATQELCDEVNHVRWLWAPIKPIKILLEVASESSAVFDEIAGAYMKVGVFLPDLRHAEKSFMKSPAFYHLLAEICDELLEFHRSTYKLLRRVGWKTLFESSWKGLKLRHAAILHNLERQGNLVSKEASFQEAEDAARAKTKSMTEVARREQEQAAQTFTSVISWLDAIDYEQEDELERLNGRIFTGTGDWLISHPVLTAWRERRGGNDTIRLQGKPGSGKSILCSQVIKVLREEAESIVLFYFCNISASSSRNPQLVLRSLIAQLIGGRRDLSAYVFDQYTVKLVKPSMTSLKELLPSLLSIQHSVRIIIDGLDEFDTEDQKTLVPVLLRLTNTEGTCKILLSNRDDSYLNRALQKKPRVYLSEESTHVRSSIQKFVHQHLLDRAETIGSIVLEAEILASMESRIIKKSEEMFLWVRLVLGTLEDVHSLGELENAIDALPGGLIRMYGQIFERVNSRLAPNNRSKAMRILAWLAYSKRPLRAYEIQDAIVFDTENSELSDYNKLSAQVFELCKPLIEERSNSTISFIHSTVKEFLTTGREPLLRKEDAIFTVAVSCITYLSTCYSLIDTSQSIQARRLQVGKGFHGFHLYATEFWLEHVFDFASNTNQNSVDAETMHTRLKHFANISRVHEHERSLKRYVRDDVQNEVLERVGSLKTCREGTQMFSNVLFYRHLLLKSQNEENQNKAKSTADKDPTGLSKVSQTYSDMVQYILHAPTLEGLSDDRHKSFRNLYGKTAYVCSYRGCPRTTEGFSSEKEKVQHELLHTQRYHCNESTCPFSRAGFTTMRSLKQHMQDYHGVEPAIRDTLRRSKTRPRSPDTENPRSHPVRREDQMMSEDASVNLANDSKNPVNILDDLDSLDNEESIETEREFHFDMDSVQLTVSDAERPIILHDAIKHASILKNRYPYEARVRRLFSDIVRLHADKKDLELIYPLVLHMHTFVQSLFQYPAKHLLPDRPSRNDAVLDLTDLDEQDVLRASQFSGDDWFALADPNFNTKITIELVHRVVHDYFVEDIAFDAKGGSFATTSHMTVRVFDLNTGKQLARFSADDTIQHIQFSADRKLVTACGMVMKFWDWNVSPVTMSKEMTGHRSTITAMALSPGGKWLASGDFRGKILIWDVKSAEVRIPLNGKGSVSDLAVNSSSTCLAASFRDGQIIIWDTMTWSETIIAASGSGTSDLGCPIAFVDDSHLVFFERNYLRQYNVFSRQAKETFEISSFPRRFRMSPCGTALLTCSSNNELLILNPSNSFRTMLRITGNVFGFGSCAVSTDGFYIASAGNDARIWRFIAEVEEKDNELDQVYTEFAVNSTSTTTDIQDDEYWFEHYLFRNDPEALSIYMGPSYAENKGRPKKDKLKKKASCQYWPTQMESIRSTIAAGHDSKEQPTTLSSSEIVDLELVKDKLNSVAKLNLARQQEL